MWINEIYATNLMPMHLLIQVQILPIIWLGLNWTHYNSSIAHFQIASFLMLLVVMRYST
jgi:hypothetical protein